MAIHINGLPLPRDLMALILTGRWRCPADLSGVDRLFPERGELKLYSPEYMPFENKHWLAETDPMFLGAPDPDNPPGDLDPRRSVLVGDLGIGYDQPIALDYRESVERPRVVTLRWLGRGENNRWVVVAPDVRAFAELVGL